MRLQPARATPLSTPPHPAMNSPFATLKPDTVAKLAGDGLPAGRHRWSQSEIDALTLAHAARRPLLVRGEPGTGKTQLARAAAHHLGWRLHAVVIHPRFEPQDLIVRFDAVARLADAQAGQGGLKPDTAYYQPGPLWQAIDWPSAKAYQSCANEKAAAGHVLLIDEIDKADSDLPNSLLEVLGQHTLRVPGLGLGLSAQPGHWPLVLITTNEERELPPAFLRRCIVLNVAPEGDYAAWLVQRGQAHFGPGGVARVERRVMEHAADQLVLDRKHIGGAGLPPPGPAEYLDLLGALNTLAPGDTPQQLKLLDELSRYAYIKAAHDPSLPPEASQRRTPLPIAAETRTSAKPVARTARARK